MILPTSSHPVKTLQGLVDLGSSSLLTGKGKKLCTLLLLFLCQAFSQGYVYSRNIQTFGNHSLLRIQTHPKSHTGKTKAFNHDHLMMSCLMFMTLCSHQSYFMGWCFCICWHLQFGDAFHLMVSYIMLCFDEAIDMMIVLFCMYIHTLETLISLWFDAAFYHVGLYYVFDLISSFIAMHSHTSLILEQ